MKRYSLLRLVNISLIVLAFSLPSCFFLDEVEVQLTGVNTGPYITSWENLEEVNLLISDNDPDLIEAFDLLMERADKWLDQEPFSVTHSQDIKKKLSTDSDAHDYVSLSTYAHPNPDTESGLPYIDIQSVRNPEVDLYDRVPLANLSKAVDDLSLAYYHTGEERYAGKTAELIKTWFLNEETLMNPHLKYAQIKPDESGIPGGSPQGIVEARDLIPIIEAACLIYDSRYWSEEDHRELKMWYYRFLEWMTRNYGPTASEGSNVGTWIDAQKIIFALFTEQEHLLQFENFIRPHQEKQTLQISVDGKQEHENRFNKELHYNYLNLKGHIVQTELRRHVKKTSDDLLTASFLGNGRLRAALNLLPDEFDIWENPRDFNICRYIEIYLPASKAFNDASYDAVVDRLIRKQNCYDIQTLLTHPRLLPRSGS